MLSFNKHKFRLGRDQWGGSICECFTFPRGEGVGKQVGWFVMLPWAAANVLLVPPTTIWGGWPTFCLSLGLTGFTTALIGDLASLFGCVTGVSDPITAITFVALGTSLPDTFASRTAALNEPDADAAITNVTGSNSVNVFLGLGLTWMIGSCYWATLDDPEKLAEWYPSLSPIQPRPMVGGSRATPLPPCTVLQGDLLVFFWGSSLIALSPCCLPFNPHNSLHTLQQQENQGSSGHRPGIPKRCFLPECWQLGLFSDHFHCFLVDGFCGPAYPTDGAASLPRGGERRRGRR
jgi:hypothetical protein